MKKKILFLALFFLSAINLRAQNPESNTPMQTPISPNAASLGMYGNIPVGHYTGIPEISIPIYEIDLDGKIFPINLSYHASGIKVAQEASTVGLGWTLNMGGVITKNIRGSSDDFNRSHNGYYYDTGFPKNPDNDPSYALTIDSYYDISPHYTYSRYYSRICDSEPDLYHFNFASFSGALFFDKQQGSSTIARPMIQNEKQYLDITYNTSTEEWKIIDGDGYQYLFKTYELSTSYISTKSFYDELSLINNEHSLGWKPVNLNAKTAWYLDKIISPQNNIITFKYEKDQIYTPIFVNEDFSYQYRFHINHSQGKLGELFQNFYSYYMYSYSICEQAIPMSVDFPGGSISLTYGDRYDLESTDKNKKPRKLERIVVSDMNNQPFRSATFINSHYPVDNTLTSRLILYKALIDDQEYSFKYYDQAILPRKNSYQVDYWGYKSNAIKPQGSWLLLSPPIIVTKSTGDEILIDGLDRKPNLAQARVGTLQSIEYPTGGKSVFEYELHTFTNPFSTERTKEWIMDFNYATFDVDEIISESEEFTLNEETDVYYMASISDMLQGTLNRVDLILERAYPDFRSVTRFELARAANYRGMLKLSPGTYRMRIVNENPLPGDLSVSCSMYSYKMIPIAQGAGLRIKSILNYSDTNNYTEKTYVYRSGLLMGYPTYQTYFNCLRAEYNFDRFMPVYEILGQFVNGNSDSYYPFNLSAQGNHVGYSIVEERIINQERDEGYTVYTFWNNLNNREEFGEDQYIRGYPITPCLNNGLPTWTYHYDSNKKLIRKIEYEHSKEKEGAVDGFVISQLPIYDPVPFEEDGTYFIKYYKMNSERWLLREVKETDFFDTGSITKTIQYTYNDYLLKTKEKTTINNDIYEIHIKYPTDYTDNIAQGMVQKRMVSKPIEILHLKNNAVISGEKTIYYDTLGMFLPQFIQRLNISSPLPISSYQKNYSNEIYYGKYNEYGKPTLSIDRNNVPTVYLWAQQGLHLIAEIKNATYADVKTALGNVVPESLSSVAAPNYTQLNALRNHSALKNSLITIFNYIPLVGLSSVADPSGRITTYQYDAYGRLSSAKDDQGNFIEHYEYNYKNQ